MRYATMIALFLTVLPALPALGGEGAASGPAKPTNDVDMPILVAPMEIDGKLDSYAYLNPVLTAASDTDVLKIRDKTPFLQDAFLRDVNAASITDPTDPQKVDVPALKKRLLADARRLVGAATVRGLSFAKIAITPLTPGRPARSQPAS